QQKLQESHPSRIALIKAIWAQNQLAFDDHRSLIEGPLDGAGLISLIETYQPDSVLVTDPSIVPEVLLKALRRGAMGLRLILAGPAMEHSERWQSVFPPLGATRAEDPQPEILIARLTRAS